MSLISAATDFDNSVKQAVLDLAARQGFGKELVLTLLPGGRNNRVYRVDCTSTGSIAVLKSYFKHPADPRDRCATEFGFVSFLWEQGIRCIPRPLQVSSEQSCALYEFVQGEHLTESAIDSTCVEAAIAFYLAINSRQSRMQGANLQAASEACFSIGSHLERAHGRVKILVSATEGPMDEEAKKLINSCLVPAWEKVRSLVLSDCAGLQLAIEEEIPLDRRMLSPSDFGFHNVLRRTSGELCFVDFEYAGWDDIAKTICDFCLQPSIRVPPRGSRHFAERILELCENRALEAHRARILLPVHQIKWACIMLNEFLPVGDSRRTFSLGKEESSERRRRQLDLAATTIQAVDTPSEIGL